MKLWRSGILSALSTAAMLTTALIGVFYFAWRVAGLPFVPFDTFDWQSGYYPGPSSRSASGPWLRLFGR
jgi:hypothetical protein